MPATFSVVSRLLVACTLALSIAAQPVVVRADEPGDLTPGVSASPSAEPIADEQAPTEPVQTPAASEEPAPDAVETEPAAPETDAPEPAAPGTDVTEPSSPEPPVTDEPSEEPVEDPAPVEPLADAVEPAAADAPAVRAATGTLLGGFEIDGDLTPGTMSPAGLDWDSPEITYGEFFDGFEDATQLKGKENEPDGWQAAAPGTAPAKGDFDHIRWYSRIVDGKQYLFLSMTRASGTGSVNYNVELNQVKAPAGQLQPTRTEGDLLVSVSQGGGGAFHVSSVSRWNGANWVSFAAAGAIVGSDNATELPGLAVSEFFELGINITEVETDAGAGKCDRVAFEQIDIRTRASDEDKSQLGDRARFSALVPVDCPVLSIEKINEQGDLVAGATFTITPNPATGIGTLTVKDGAAADLDDRDGIIGLKSEDEGEFTVEEVAAPEGYLLPKDRAQIVQLAFFETTTVEFVDPLPFKPLTITNTATGAYSSQYAWTIEKLVNTTHQNVPGDTAATYSYTVRVGQAGVTTTHLGVTGTVKITNPNEQPMRGTVDVTLQNDADAVCTIDATDADPGATGIQHDFPAGVTSLTYTCEGAAVTGVNSVASVTWSAADYPADQDGVDHPEEAGTVKATASAPVAFTGTDVNKTITVTDTFPQFGDDWTITYDTDSPSSTLSRSYSVALGADPGTCSTKDNTAAITELDLEDSVSVTTCAGADLSIDKQAVTSFARTYLWDIVKTPRGDGPYATDADGNVTVTYDVTVTNTGSADSNWKMDGEITVTNPNDWQDVTATVSDEVALGEGATCTVTGAKDDPAAVDLDAEKDGFQVVIPRSKTMVFEYECMFTEQPDYVGSNTAKVTWDAEAASTPLGAVQHRIEIVEDDWTQTPINDEITVEDSLYEFDPAWTVKAGGEPTTREYPVTWKVTEPGTCQSFDNTASVVNRTETLDSSTATIEACRQADLTADIDASAWFSRTFNWSIDKNLAEGQEAQVYAKADGTASIDYEATVSVVGHTDGKWRADGSVEITNPNDVMSVRATIEVQADHGGVCTVDAVDVDPEVDGVQVDIAAEQVVPAAYTCTFADLSESDYGDVAVSATVAWDGGATSTDEVPVPFATYDADAWAANREVAVHDDLGDPAGEPELLGTVKADEAPVTFSYTLDLEGIESECLLVTNTAWVLPSVTPEIAVLVDAGQGPDHALATDEAEVSVCPQSPLTLALEGAGTFDRDYHWRITKTVDAASKTVTADGKAEFDYVVQALPDGFSDAGHAAAGAITLANQNTEAVSVTLGTLTGPAGMECSAEATDADPEADGLQVVVPAEGTTKVDFRCTGTPAAPDASAASVTLTYVDLTGDEHSLSATVPVAFALAGETDKTVTVFDDLTQPAKPRAELGTATWNAEGTATQFAYRLQVWLASGDLFDEFTNTAQIGENGPKASTTVTVLRAKPTPPKTGAEGQGDAVALLPFLAVVAAAACLARRP
ncbi:prealbumin-like fold domain-containing protein [Tessaracoccus aquimaris]|uniref:prealbumin-like fold domain-containing protein n=1 Tax=Tessaracoccus aquimaris TaxID=1332264 RepID=UPI0011AB60F6|nr:prealbumin-like fold domain-containing protein [Tessaracoccus aquimaris]